MYSLPSLSAVTCKDNMSYLKMPFRTSQLIIMSKCGKAVNTQLYRGADKSLARPGRKQATAREDFEFHISYL
jgi:hypothetical protein